MLLSGVPAPGVSVSVTVFDCPGARLTDAGRPDADSPFERLDVRATDSGTLPEARSVSVTATGVPGVVFRDGRSPSRVTPWTSGTTNETAAVLDRLGSVALDARTWKGAGVPGAGSGPLG